MSIYTRSELYKKYIELDDEKEIQDLFNHKFKEKCNLTIDEVSYFLDNFTKISYNEDNINNYIHLVSFFDYDIRKDFLRHLVYIFKNIANSNALDHLYSFFGYNIDYNIIKEYFYFCQQKEKSDFEIKHEKDKDIKTKILIKAFLKIDHNIILNEISKLIDLNDKLLKHIKLYTLNASGYYCSITDEGIKHMQLDTLDASDNPKITDKGIKHMQLHTLNASYYDDFSYGITDEGIKHMQLHTLYASFNSFITDDGYLVFDSF
jgi:hypothetical protein